MGLRGGWSDWCGFSVPPWRGVVLRSKGLVKFMAQVHSFCLEKKSTRSQKLSCEETALLFLGISCLDLFSIAGIKYHGQSDLQNRAFGLMISEGQSP